MRKIRSIAAVLLTAVLMTALPVLPAGEVEAGGYTVAINTSTFPDPALRSFVKDNYSPDDWVLTQEEIEKVTVMDLYDKGIQNIQGVNYFENLETLILSGNPLNCTLNLSYNKKLTYLAAGNCGLKGIVLLANPDLRVLDLDNNPDLHSVNVSNLKDLEFLTLNNTPVSKLVVTSNTNLHQLACQNCGLSKLDVSNNTKLEYLDCSMNSIDSLNVRNCPDLHTLYCGSNPMTSLDISKNTKLYSLYIYDVPLQDIDITNSPILCDLYRDGVKETDYNVTTYSYGLPHDNDIPKTWYRMMVKSSTVVLITRTITVKWSSIDGKKVKPDKVYKIREGNTFSNWFYDHEEELDEYFKTDGYYPMDNYLPTSPMTAFKDSDDFNHNVKFPEYLVKKDVTVYYYMLKPYDKVSLEVDSPVCGTSTSSGSTDPVLISDQIDDYVSFWKSAKDTTKSYEGNFEAGGTYVAEVYGHINYGYCLDKKTKIDLNGMEVVKAPQFSDGDDEIGGMFKVKGDHDWGKASYSWSSDNSKVTATAACNKHKDKTLKETVNTTSKVTKQPTTTSTGTKVLTATFSNSHFATQTKTVTIPSLTPTPKPDAAGVGGFVDRLYQEVLGRNADPNGKADWIDRVMTKGKTGADIALGFLFSPEFLNKNMDNGDFLEILYKVFFDRKSDPAGKADWLNRMANGWTKSQVIWGFINSTEWANVCLKYGIPSGGTGIPNATIEPNEKVIAFATRLYKTCLGREPEPEGLKNWSLQLANMKVSGTAAAKGFFFSQEFIDHNYSNDEFVKRLYRTFMGREADTAGYNDWMGRLAAGATREDVFYGFANSPEFQKICADYGILR